MSEGYKGRVAVQEGSQRGRAPLRHGRCPGGCIAAVVT
jgi:hypothetical protein